MSLMKVTLVTFELSYDSCVVAQQGEGPSFLFLSELSDGINHTKITNIYLLIVDICFK